MWTTAAAVRTWGEAAPPIHLFVRDHVLIWKFPNPGRGTNVWQAVTAQQCRTDHRNLCAEVSVTLSRSALKCCLKSPNTDIDLRTVLQVCAATQCKAISFKLYGSVQRAVKVYRVISSLEATPL